MNSIQQVIEVVEAVEAKGRIFVPEPVTFFSKHDYWLYIEVSDNKLCPVCRANAKMEGEGLYYGNHLRAFFPHLEIHDANTIKVNEHPNCRCVLVRVKTVENWFA